MKAMKFSIVQYIVLLWCLLFSPGCKGCKKWLEQGDFIIVGIATVNGKEYVDMRNSKWNRDFDPVSVAFYPHYNMIEVSYILLQPQNLGEIINWDYRINICLTTDNQPIQTNLPYKIEYNKTLESNIFIPKGVKKTLVFDKSKIISPDVNNGIAIVANLKTNETHSMEGYLIIHHLDYKNRSCEGEYMLKTPAISEKEELTINGKFRAELYESNLYILK